MGGLPRPSAWFDDKNDGDLRGAFLDPQRHLSTLATLSRRHRGRGDARAAFAFADRCCRLTFHRDAFALLLRAEASEELGDEAGFHADLEAAFTTDPLLPAVAKRVLAKRAAGNRREVARLILASPWSDRSARLEAFDALLQEFDVVTDLCQSDLQISGRLAWKGTRPIEVQVGEGDGWIEIARDPDLSSDVHDIASARLPLEANGFGAAARLEDLRARSGPDGRRRYDIGRQPLPSQQPDAASLPETAPAITVVLPVFGHRRMTQICLLALLRQFRDSPDLRVLIVDDNPDHSVLTSAMARIGEAPGVEVLRNDRNLGFAGSVNRALSAITAGDVILLNADAVLPPNAIERLAKASRAAPGIGTVTPFSNNGEEASFPSPFYPGRLPSYRRLQEIDRLAAAANGSTVVDMVNGIGFCLYVTRAALQAVGRLPIVYDRGYYEDIEFTLAVRDAGLRNVCATGIYVGHRGAGSFAGSKSALVARNLRILAQKYPSYVGESAGFIAADPLRASRAAIERELPLGVPARDLLILAPADVQKSAIYRKALELTQCLCLSWLNDGGKTLIVWMSDGSPPQSLQFNGERAFDELRDYLSLVGVATAHIAGLAFTYRELIQDLQESGLAIELLFDDSLLQIASARTGTDCDLASGSGPCEACADAFAKAPVRGHAGAPLGLNSTLKTARRVRPLNEMARAVATHFQLKNGHPIDFDDDTDFSPGAEAGTLGILARAGDPLVERLIHAVAHVAERDGRRLVVFGAGLDSLRLMSSPSVFVSGVVAEPELPRLLAAYAVDRIFAPNRWSGYGTIERHAGGRPAAFFDWSGGLFSKKPHDLALDPRVCDRKIAVEIDKWWQGAEALHVG